MSFFKPPFTKYKGYTLGGRPSDDPEYPGHGIFMAEVRRLETTTGEDVCGYRACALIHAIDERHGTGYRANCDEYLYAPFCWCGKWDCPWCLDDVGAPAEVLAMADEEQDAAADAQRARLFAGLGLPAFDVLGGQPPGLFRDGPRCAPNLWLKKHDLAFWWYKHPGRDMWASRPYKSTEILAIGSELGFKL